MSCDSVVLDTRYCAPPTKGNTKRWLSLLKMLLRNIHISNSLYLLSHTCLSTFKQTSQGMTRCRASRGAEGTVSWRHCSSNGTHNGPNLLEIVHPFVIYSRLMNIVHFDSVWVTFRGKPLTPQPRACNRAHGQAIYPGPWKGRWPARECGLDYRWITLD